MFHIVVATHKHEYDHVERVHQRVAALQCDVTVIVDLGHRHNRHRISVTASAFALVVVLTFMHHIFFHQLREM
jgi:hypothetical protein